MDSFFKKNGFQVLAIPGLSNVVHQKVIDEAYGYYISIISIPYDRAWIIGLGNERKTLMLRKVHSPLDVEREYRNMKNTVWELLYGD